MSQKISEAIRRQSSDMSLTSIVLNLAEDTNVLLEEIATYPTTQFISDVGGLAGLVLGISMLSILTGTVRKLASKLTNKSNNTFFGDQLNRVLICLGLIFSESMKPILTYTISDWLKMRYRTNRRVVYSGRHFDIFDILGHGSCHMIIDTLKNIRLFRFIFEYLIYCGFYEFMILLILSDY